MLKVGQNVDVKTFINECKSVVTNIIGDCVHFYMPTEKGVLIELQQSEEILLLYMENKSLYEQRVKVKSIYEENNIKIVQAICTDKPQKAERRGFYRVKEAILFDIENGDTDKDYFKTSDISGGGLCFHADRQFEVGDKLKGNIHLENNIDIPYEGIVVRKIELSKRKNEFGVRFIAIEFKKQEKLLSYIFDIQRRDLKKRSTSWRMHQSKKKTDKSTQRGNVNG